MTVNPFLSHLLVCRVDLLVMALSTLEIITTTPIGGGLNDFLDSYNATRTGIPELSGAVGHMHIGDEGEICQLDA